jgi:hypothetical protein
MDGLERRVREHPLAAGMIILLLGIFLGIVAGALFAFDAVRSISETARASNPHDPLDMLTFVAFGYIAVGCCGGTVAGLAVAIIVYFANRQRGSQLLSN